MGLATLVGLILDTSILIAGERRGESALDTLRSIRAKFGEVNIALSSVSVVELAHGMYRARTATQRVRREMFAQAIFTDLIVHPFSMDIALLAGQIEGQQAAKGVSMRSKTSLSEPQRYAWAIKYSPSM